MADGHAPRHGVAVRMARVQERAQLGRGLESCSRFSRVALTGSLSAMREAVGRAVVRSMQKVVWPRPRKVSLSRDFDHAMVTRAP